MAGEDPQREFFTRRVFRVRAAKKMQPAGSGCPESAGVSADTASNRPHCLSCRANPPPPSIPNSQIRQPKTGHVVAGVALYLQSPQQTGAAVAGGMACHVSGNGCGAGRASLRSRSRICGLCCFRAWRCNRSSLLLGATCKVSPVNDRVKPARRNC